MPLEPRARVLVADDNELFRLLLGSMLSNAGIDVTGARTGAEALAPQIRPDAALLDWRMPGGGLTLARALIADYGMADRVIMITALDDPRDRRAAHKAGIAWYLVKPPDRDELMAAVRAAISGRPGPQHQRASGSSQPSATREVVTLDPAQLDSLRRSTGDRCSELVAGMIEDTDKLVAELPAAVARDDFSAVVEAAHRGRNDALVVGASEFGDVFAVLQTAARKAQLGAVQEAVERLQAMWPATRAAIVDLLVRPRSNS